MYNLCNTDAREIVTAIKKDAAASLVNHGGLCTDVKDPKSMCRLSQSRRTS